MVLPAAMHTEEVVVADAWSGRKVTEARTIVATWLPTTCPRCSRTVGLDDQWVVGHKIARSLRPDLMFEVSNWQAEHRACSDRTGQAAVIEKARAEGRAEVSGSSSSTRNLNDFSHEKNSNQPPPLPVSPSAARDATWTVPERLSWTATTSTAPEWLRPYLVVPEDASPPLAMTPPHPLAVGSYGPQAIEWIETRRGITLRWWQALALVRQLEHDLAGRLVWPLVVESAPRRAGKSERLRSLALWRMEHGVDLFEPDQIVVHVGRDLAIVREVQQRAWSWCEAQDWSVTRGNGKEVVTHPNGARWLAKAQHGGYGFDVHLGLADECWDVDPGAISEGIEPATLDRESAQLVLTSTSHRRATSLMKRRILSALTVDDGRTLLLLWGVTPDADMFAEETWRAASPYWTEERRAMIASKLQEAQEAGPELDDPDPVGSWAHQYLNRWDLTVRKQERGEQVVTSEVWSDLLPEGTPGSDDAPMAAAIESWFGAGVSLAIAWRWRSSPGNPVVSVSDYDSLEDCVAGLRASGYRGRVVVGASLLEDPALSTVRKVKGAGSVGLAAQELRRLAAEDGFRHDGGEHLTAQVLAMRTLPGADGPRMASQGRADAVKAAVWAIGRARVGGQAKRGIVVSSI